METNGTQSTAMVHASTALEPQSIGEAMTVAGHLAKSGVLGKTLQRPEAALAIIMAGRELGLTAMQSMRSLHIIDGKVVLSSDTMLALVKRSSQCRYFRLVESTDKVATYETERTGEGGPTRMSFDIAQATAAKLTGKDNWRTYPAAMLRARCIAALARAVYPDVLMGVYETDEMQTRQAIPAGGVIDAEYSVEPATEAQEAVAQDKTADYRAAIAAAPTSADLARVAEALSKEPTAIKESVRAEYQARAKALKATPKAEREAGEEG